MLGMSQFLALLKILFAPRAEIILENIALRHQISVLSRQFDERKFNLLAGDD